VTQKMYACQQSIGRFDFFFVFFRLPHTQRNKQMGKGASKITKEELEDLEKKSNFTEEELRRLYKGFRKENPKGVMSFDTWLESPANPVRGNRELSKRWFDLYDNDKSGQIEFRELAILLGLIVKGTPEQKLGVVFSFYDESGDGSLTKEEMKKVFEHIFNAAKQSNSLHLEGLQTVDEYVEKFFALVDIDGDGTVTKEEFIKVAQNADQFPIIKVLL